MPKINAATVDEHRAKQLERIVAAAEQILAEGGVSALTAGRVAARAGLARNSLYRYFSSISELIELVATRDFPRWAEAVRSSVNAASPPPERIVAYVESSLRQASTSTHGWRSDLSRASLPAAARRRILELHTELHEIAQQAFTGIDDDDPALLFAVVQAIIDACTKRIDAGSDPEHVIAYAVAATRRLVTNNDAR